MSKNNTLCIAEWQSFDVDDIKSVIASKSQDLHSNINKTPLEMDCHDSANTESCNDKKSNNDKTPNEKELVKKIEEKAQNTFKELQNFANQKGNFDDREGNHIFLTPYRNEQLKAKNYVGLIQTKSGFCLEILPKTFSTEKDNKGFMIKNCSCNNSKENPCPICEAKDILLNMLKTLRNSPFKQSHISTLKTHKYSLLEVFANMFLDEVELLIKRGIKSDYVPYEKNRTFLKGKLLFNENLKLNFAHKQRFFTVSDEFITDIAPNRLIVSTILFLSKQNFSLYTSGRINQIRFIFEDINPSKNIDKDFAKCPNSRHYKSYELLLLWCKLFLKQQSFMPYQGEQKAFALLFDMNKLFENFVAWHLKRECGKGRIIKSQESHKYLLKVDEINKFQMKPDLVCYEGGNKIPLFIADTKWKILDSNESNSYGISQGDLYQVFAYLTKYQCNKGYLIYPNIANNDKIKDKTFTYKAQVCFYGQYNPIAYTEHSKQTIKLQICFFDIREPRKSSREIFDKF